MAICVKAVKFVPVPLKVLRVHRGTELSPPTRPQVAAPYLAKAPLHRIFLRQSVLPVGVSGKVRLSEPEVGLARLLNFTHGLKNECIAAVQPKLTLEYEFVEVKAGRPTPVELAEPI